MNPSATRDYRWSGDSNPHIVVWIESGYVGAMGGKMAGREKGDRSDGRGVGLYQGWK